MQDFRQIVLRQGLKHNMNVVRHDAPSEKHIAQSGKMIQNTGNHPRHCRPPENAGTRTRIKKFLEAGVEKQCNFLVALSRLAFRDGSCEGGELVCLNSFKGGAGERVGEPEGDEVNAAICFPVRESPALAN